MSAHEPERTGGGDDAWGRTSTGGLPTNIGRHFDHRLPECYWSDDDGMYVMQTLAPEEWVSANANSIVPLDDSC